MEQFYLFVQVEKINHFSLIQYLNQCFWINQFTDRIDNPSQTAQFRITITETFWYDKNDKL